MALCRKGEVWHEENLTKLMNLGIKGILNVPCDSTSIGGLYMVLLLSGFVNEAFTESDFERIIGDGCFTTV